MSQALYQKYRPITFDQVIGQDVAVSYFQKIVAKDSVSSKSDYHIINHAYLITGGRGTGKTTLARIFARELGTADIDIAELDMASNRGIEEAREIRDYVLSRPVSSKYKVYILDEAHMITTIGANALLKTIEEPTPWTIFILCTTDPDRLIDTIVSRCQVINLDAPTVEYVYALLSKINEEESLGHDQALLQSIAEHSHEAYRDAIGFLEWVSSGVEVSSDIKISLSKDYNAIAFDIIKSIINKDTKSIFTQISAFDIEHTSNAYHRLYIHILEVFRFMLLHKVGVDGNFKKAGGDIKKDDISQDIKNFTNVNKDKIRSDTLRILLDHEKTWKYNSISNREKLELIMLNTTSV